MVDETLRIDTPIKAGSCCGTERAANEVPAAAGCCGPAPKATASCCGSDTAAPRRIDWFLWASAALAVLGYGWHLIAGGETHGAMDHFAMGVFELFNIMWWGIVLGIVFVGLLDRVPRDVIIAALAGERRTTGILRATAAGVAFDLCSHGILMVGMKLYERGATIGQTVAFLLASPWNSFSLTIILIALIGWWYTLLFILLSAVIAVATGYLFDLLVARGRLPDNPARTLSGPAPALWPAIRAWLAGKRFTLAMLPEIARAGLSGSRTVLRWLLFGVVLAAAIRALVPAEVFTDWFGPTLLGVVLTLVAATIIEVCSEGATPIAADLVSRAAAPGNGFVFLMGGGRDRLYRDHVAARHDPVLADRPDAAVDRPAPDRADRDPAEPARLTQPVCRGERRFDKSTACCDPFTHPLSSVNKGELA